MCDITGRFYGVKWEPMCDIKAGIMVYSVSVRPLPRIMLYNGSLCVSPEARIIVYNGALCVKPEAKILV